jgi:CubicO group peptidase (beta-lactamase class C family)
MKNTIPWKMRHTSFEYRERWFGFFKPGLTLFHLIVFFLSTFGGSVGADTVLDANRMKDRLDTAINSAIESRRIIGTVVVILRDGKQIYKHAAGLADRESDRPMEPDTIFRLASVTKPIVTVAVLRLIDEGTLNLKDPVTKYLPDFKPRLPDGSSPEITIQQLLNHTAGLTYGFLEPPDGPYHKANVSDGLDMPGLSMEEELHRITLAGLAFSPGTKWGYSVSMDVLGAVIEKATGTSLPEAVKRLVTGPAGLANTGFTSPDINKLATPYADGSPPVRMTDPHRVPFFGLAGINFSTGRVFDPRSFPSGGSGMNGTAEDVAALLDIIRDGGRGLIKPDSSRAMMKNQIGDLPVFIGPGWGFGFGGAVLKDPQAAMTPQSKGTWTWGGVWGHSWFVDPELGLVVVALTNTAIEGMAGQFSVDIRNAVYGNLRK